ncbi:MAG: hypothetical protein ACRELD_12630 [Longimicrobiales bacterium]
MSRWSAVALALRRASDDDLNSRLATYLHPLAGRPLAWHVLDSIAALNPRPLQTLLVSGDTSLPPALEHVRVETIFPARGIGWAVRVSERLHPSVQGVLILDAAAAALGASLHQLVEGPPQRALVDAAGEPVAVWLERDALVQRARTGPDLAALVADCHVIAPAPPDAFLVRDREGLARAGVLVRDRTVSRLMQGGVSFLLPETAMVDVGVTIGADTLVYPGVVLEGETTIGRECVIGPGCRIIDSRLGNGVELKGWNFVVNTALRNRAVLEPYVRRGYD